MGLCEGKEGRGVLEAKATRLEDERKKQEGTERREKGSVGIPSTTCYGVTGREAMRFSLSQNY